MCVHSQERVEDLVVRRRELVADGVVCLTLACPHGGAVPAWEPGAHIDLVLGPGPEGPGKPLVRQYSLCGDPGDSSTLRVAVLRADAGRGGSIFVHDRIADGGTVRIRGPRNHFALVESPRYLFVAGGIGITPILPMIDRVQAAGAEWALLYGGRTRESMAFREELVARHGVDRVLIRPEDEYGRLDLAGFLGEPRAGVAIYCCGPEPLLAAMERLVGP